MSTTAIPLPRVSPNEDLLEVFACFHESVRDVAAWMPTIVDSNGAASARDARWLRSFVKGPLAWHCADEESVLIPGLAAQRSVWLDACLARACAKHRVITEQAQQLLVLLEPLCAGDTVPLARWGDSARQLAAAVEDSLRYEDDVVLPSARLFLDAAERAEMVRQIVATDDTRPWPAATIAEDARAVRRVHAVVTRAADGPPVIRSFAHCPRGHTSSAGSCAVCPHLESLRVDDRGVGEVTCAMDDGGVPRDTRVADIMTRDVICIDKRAPVTDVVQIFAESCVTGLPVVDDVGRAVGVVSQSDVVAALARGADIAGLRVVDVMMHAPFVVRESDSIEDATRLIISEGVHRLPVINVAMVVVGIVSTLDLLRASIKRPPLGAR